MQQMSNRAVKLFPKNFRHSYFETLIVIIKVTGFVGCTIDEHGALYESWNKGERERERERKRETNSAGQKQNIKNNNNNIEQTIKTLNIKILDKP